MVEGNEVISISMGPVGLLIIKVIHGGQKKQMIRKINGFVLCRVQNAVVGNAYTCSPRFSESCHRQFPTARGAVSSVPV